MSHAIDITGQRFGSLTVVGRAEKRPGEHHSYWLCRCECGRTRRVAKPNLVARGDLPCTCREAKDEQRNGDMIGQVFSCLTVIGRAPRRPTVHDMIWRCRCVCGKELDVRASTLKKGATKSCGCSTEAIKKATRAANGTRTGPKAGTLSVSAGDTSSPSGRASEKPEAPISEAHSSAWITDKAWKPEHQQVVLIRVKGTAEKALPGVDLARYSKGRTNPWFSLTRRESLPDFLVTGWAPTPEA